MKRARLHRSLWQEAGRAFRATIRSSRNSGQVPGAASGLRFPNQTCRVRPKNGCGLRHLPLAFAGSGLFRRNPRARTERGAGDASGRRPTATVRDDPLPVYGSKPAPRSRARVTA